MGDEPYTWRDRFEERLEAQGDVLRDIQRDQRELHERIRAVEGHTHDGTSPPKNGNGKRKEWRWILAVGIGTFLAALARELGVQP